MICPIRLWTCKARSKLFPLRPALEGYFLTGGEVDATFYVRGCLAAPRSKRFGRPATTGGSDRTGPQLERCLPLGRDHLQIDWLTARALADKLPSTVRWTG